jgi:predicted amidophosphoribosyltransferase
VLSFFLPEVCIHCSAPAGKEEKNDEELLRYLCKNCLRQFRSLLEPSPLDLESKQHLFSDIDAVIRFHTPYPFVAEGIPQSIVHHFKYNDMPRLAVLIGKELTTRLRDAEYDMMLPVPLHSTRLGERGYNQSEKLAEGIASVLKIPVAKKQDSHLRKDKRTWKEHLH